MRFRRALPLLPILLPALSCLACAGPASLPATGSLADEVNASFQGGRATFDHADWNRILAAATRQGLVDYRYVQDHRPELDAYLSRVASADLGKLARPQLEALLINAYNALTIRSILDHPTVASIRDIPGVWGKVTHVVGGHEVTLDQIEHNLLRPFFKDPRIHFAVNCASMSCAPLASEAWDGDRIAEQLDAAARRFLSDPRQVRLEGGTLRLSSYFKWYGGDFTAEGWRPRAGTIPEFVALYAAPEVAAAIRSAGSGVKIDFLDYDWKLNASEAPVTAPAAAP
jgi:hypothetical protein